MCKLGDIIVVKQFKNEEGNIVSKHSFVVINDEPDFVQGLKYDFVSNMMCSFHSKIHKTKKLKYKENLLVKEGYLSGDKINNKEGYIKADQLYYFNKKRIKYKVIAHMDDELLDELVKIILILHDNNKIKMVTDNLQ